MPLVLNMPGFWIWRSSEYLKSNMSKYTWRAIVLQAPIVIPSLLDHVVTYFHKVYALIEHEAVFLKRQKLPFSIVAGSIWFFFYFRLHIFTSKISNMLLLFRAEEAGDHESWYTIIKQEKSKFNQGGHLF